ncbi:uncharacterized protein LOC113345369 [Papaver somniferum]|uniref:uncharacterized protein LOC113345369 n=1 Tax=Papaver somniferum TaxID=3469 RepID=UPI000E704555|nr:uncharacterized protein LOC113345369 [Papaver somniferum]
MSRASVSHQIEKTICYWNPPSANQLNINFDAAWVSESLISGFGLILRNCAGNTQGAKSEFFRATCPEKEEALALLQGAKWDKEMNLKYFWIEGDCERILAFTQGNNNLVKWQNESTLKEAMLLLSGCDNFLGFIYTPRDGNQAADRLAKEAFKSSLHQSLIMPNFLSTILILDKLNCKSNTLSSLALVNSVFFEEDHLLAGCNFRASAALMGTITDTSFLFRVSLLIPSFSFLF